MRLLEDGQAEGNTKVVIVRDPRTKQVYKLCDGYTPDYEFVPYPSREVAFSRGLHITVLSYDKSNDLVEHKEERLDLPRLPELVNISNLYLVRDINPWVMRKVARHLKRAEVLK